MKDAKSYSLMRIPTARPYINRNSLRLVLPSETDSSVPLPTRLMMGNPIHSFSLLATTLYDSPASSWIRHILASDGTEVNYRVVGKN